MKTTSSQWRLTSFPSTRRPTSKIARSRPTVTFAKGTASTRRHSSIFPSKRKSLVGRSRKVAGSSAITRCSPSRPKLTAKCSACKGKIQVFTPCASGYWVSIHMWWYPRCLLNSKKTFSWKTNAWIGAKSTFRYSCKLSPVRKSWSHAQNFWTLSLLKARDNGTRPFSSTQGKNGAWETSWCLRAS